MLNSLQLNKNIAEFKRNAPVQSGSYSYSIHKRAQNLQESLNRKLTIHKIYRIYSPSPPCFMQETVVTFCAQDAKNVNNFAAILNGQSAQLVTYLLTRFCYHAQNAVALVNI